MDETVQFESVDQMKRRCDQECKRIKKQKILESLKEFQRNIDRAFLGGRRSVTITVIIQPESYVPDSVGGLPIWYPSMKDLIENAGYKIKTEKRRTYDELVISW